MDLKTIFSVTITKQGNQRQGGYRLSIVLRDHTFIGRIAPYAKFAGSLKNGLHIEKVPSNMIDKEDGYIAKWTSRKGSGDITLSLPYKFIGDPINEPKQMIEVEATVHDGKFHLKPVDMTILTTRRILRSGKRKTKVHHPLHDTLNPMDTFKLAIETRSTNWPHNLTPSCG